MKRIILHSLAAVMLALASVAIWHWRFEVDPGALPETRIAKPLVGWKSKSGWNTRRKTQHEVVIRDGKPVLRLSRANRKEALPSVSVWYGPSKHVNFIHLRCESRWQDVVRGPKNYMIARFSVHMKDQNGKVMHPPGSHVFAGLGSSEWKKSEVVLKLTDDMTDVGFAISMLGLSGTLEVRDLSVVAVRQRSWVPLATAIVVLGWSALCFSLILNHSDKPPVLNAVLAALVLVAAGWILVFPQTKVMLKPIPQTFEVGELEAAPPQPEPPPTTPTKPSPEPTKPPVTAPSIPPPTETPEPPPPVIARDSSDLHRALREVDKQFGPAHLVLFTGLTLIILLITGRDSQWRLPLVLALLAELVPELTDHLGGWDDWTDLLANFAGVGLAVLIWYRLPLLKRFRKSPAT